MRSDLHSITWLEQNSRPCPQCSFPIQKNGGCLHMRCTRCYFYFCWQCGGPGQECYAFSCRKPSAKSYGETDLFSKSAEYRAVSAYSAIQALSQVEARALRKEKEMGMAAAEEKRVGRGWLVAQAKAAPVLRLLWLREWAREAGVMVTSSADLLVKLRQQGEVLVHQLGEGFYRSRKNEYDRSRSKPIGTRKMQTLQARQKLRELAKDPDKIQLASLGQARRLLHGWINEAVSFLLKSQYTQTAADKDEAEEEEEAVSSSMLERREKFSGHGLKGGVSRSGFVGTYPRAGRGWPHHVPSSATHRSAPPWQQDQVHEDPFPPEMLVKRWKGKAKVKARRHHALGSF